MEDNKKERVAVGSFLKKLKHDLLRYVIVFVVALVGSILVILPVPRYYKCDISLAPEMDNTENGGKLSSIASSFGVDLGDVASANALQPSLYPDLMKSNEFIKSLLQIPIETKDGSVKTVFVTKLLSYPSNCFSIWRLFLVTKTVLRQRKILLTLLCLIRNKMKSSQR